MAVSDLDMFMANAFSGYIDEWKKEHSDSGIYIQLINGGTVLQEFSATMGYPSTTSVSFSGTGDVFSGSGSWDTIKVVLKGNDPNTGTPASTTVVTITGSWSYQNNQKPQVTVTIQFTAA